MQLTNKQIEAIRDMSAEMAMAVMHECAERLGLVSVSEYCKLLGLKKRTIYKAIEEKKLPCFELAGHIFLSINN